MAIHPNVEIPRTRSLSGFATRRLRAVAAGERVDRPLALALRLPHLRAARAYTSKPTLFRLDSSGNSTPVAGTNFMKRILLFLTLIVCAPVFAGVPYVVNSNGFATNTSFSGLIIKQTFGNGGDIYDGINGPGGTGPFRNDFQYRLRFANDTNGFVWFDQGGVNILATWNWNALSFYADNGILRLYPPNSLFEQATAQPVAPNPLASYNSFTPFVGGSASAQPDLPTHGPENWKSMPVPPITFFNDLGLGHLLPSGFADATNYINGQIFTNAVFQMKTNGVIGLITSASVPPTFMIDGWWAEGMHRRADGQLTNNPTLWPLGMPFYSNFSHTNGMHVRLTTYYDSHIPPYGNTEEDADTSGNGSCAFTFWPSQNPICSPWIPYTTADRVSLDAVTFFKWGADEWRIADYSPYTTASGYGNQMTRQCNWAALYPNGYIPSAFLFTNTPIIEYLNGHSGTLLPQQAVEENLVNFDQLDFGSTNNVNLLMGYERNIFEPYRWGFGKGHLPVFTMIDQAGTTNDLRSALALAAVMPFGTMLNHFYGTNEPMRAVWTNTELLAVVGVPCDNGLGVVAATNVATASTVIRRYLTNGVVFVTVSVETNSAQSVAIPWASLGLQTNQAYAIRDLSWQTNVGTFRQQYTHVAPGPFITALLFVPDSSFYATGDLNMSGQINVTNNITQYGAGAVFSAAKVVSTVNGIETHGFNANAGVSLFSRNDDASYILAYVTGTAPNELLHFSQKDSTFNFTDVLTLNANGDIFPVPVTFNSTITGNGSGLTNLNGSSIASGTVADARLGNSTNASASPDFSKHYTLFQTNAAFTVLAPINLDATKTTAQTTVFQVTNSTAAAVAITAPAGVHAQGTWFVTNWTTITFYTYAGQITNAIALPLW